MIGIASKIIKYNLYKKFGFPKTLPTIITFSVNDWCNSRCKTCNIWRNNPLEKMKEELSLKEIEKIFNNFKKIYWLTITGGEPFLKKELVDIVRVIYEKSRPEVATIATNGILANRIALWVKKILKSCKKLSLVINVSLDGIGKQHDMIRGVSGNFDLAVKTIKKLKKLNHPRLIVGINTVISKYNVKNFDEIYRYIREDLKPDSFIVEIAERRAKLYNYDLNITPKTNEYQKVLQLLINSLEKEKPAKKLAKLIKELRIEYYKNLINQSALRIFEGIASAYIMHNGEVWVSYSKPFKIGNLRNVNYDFKKLWFSKKAEKFRKIMESNYETFLANAFYANIMCNPSKIFKILLRSFFKN